MLEVKDLLNTATVIMVDVGDAEDVYAIFASLTKIDSDVFFKIELCIVICHRCKVEQESMSVRGNDPSGVGVSKGKEG